MTAAADYRDPRPLIAPDWRGLIPMYQFAHD